MSELPHSKPNECAVLGILIGRPELFASTAEKLSLESFYVPANRVIFTALGELHREAKLDGGAVRGVDGLLLRQRLVDKGRLDDIGGFEYLAAVCQAGPDEANFEHYLGIVLRDAERRQTIEAAERVKQGALDPNTDMDEVRGEAMRMLGTAQSKESSGAAGVMAMIEEAGSGNRRLIPTPWGGVDRAARPLMPQTVTLLCGGMGASKSFALLQVLAGADCRSAVYMLEESKDYHLARALAQRAALPGITDPEWLADNADLAREAYEEHEGFLDRLSQRIWTADMQPTLPQIAAWVEARARGGCKLIAVDPITAAAHTSRDVWLEDNAILQRVKTAARDSGAAVLLVTHPVKGIATTPDMNLLAGSAAYARFAQNILWLESHEAKTSTVHTDCGRAAAVHNRTLHLLKTRNAPGQGARIAFTFESASLALHEHGIITKKDVTE